MSKPNTWKAKMREIGVVALLVFSTFTKPSLAQSRHYRKGIVEKITVRYLAMTQELAETDVGPTTPGTIYIVTIRSGASVFPGQFQILPDSQYPRPPRLRLKQTVRFRTAEGQVMACDVHNVKTPATIHYLILRDERGGERYLYMSDSLHLNFNADIFPDSSSQDLPKQ